MLLEDKLRRHPSELSRGELQRFAIILFLMYQPIFLMIDEPTSNLNPFLRDRMMELLSLLNSEFKIGIIITTHDPFIISENGRLVYLEQGRVISDQTVTRHILDEQRSYFLS